MKYLLKSSVAVLAVGLLASTVAQADNLTVVSWGGAYTKSQINAYHIPWTEKTGNNINSIDYSGGLAEVRAQVEAGNVTWDVVDLELSDAVLGCDEGLFESIDKSILPNAPDGTPAQDDFLPGTLQECSVATIIWSTVYAYDTTKFTDKKPTTMADFFDLEKFPGKRGLRKGAKANLEIALIADGVPTNQVYATLSTLQGLDRAFAKLDSIRDHVVWWEAGSQPPQLLADGEVAMTTAYNGRLFNAITVENKPFEIVWDGQIWDMDLWAITKGSKNVDMALDFIAFSTDTQRLADQAKWISYGPARKSSVAMIGKSAETGVDMVPHMPTAPNNFKNPLQNDFAWWADNQDELNERFNAWLAN